MLPWPLQCGTSQEMGRLHESCAPGLVLPVCPRGLSPRRVRERGGTQRPVRQPSAFISLGMSSPAQRKKEKKKVKSLSCVQLFATSWTVAHQAPPSMEFSRQEYWSGLPFPSPGDLPDPGIEPGYHQPKGFYTFRPSITNMYHSLEECDLSLEYQSTPGVRWHGFPYWQRSGLSFSIRMQSQ